MKAIVKFILIIQLISLNKQVSKSILKLTKTTKLIKDDLAERELNGMKDLIKKIARNKNNFYDLYNKNKSVYDYVYSKIESNHKENIAEIYTVIEIMKHNKQTIGNISNLVEFMIFENGMDKKYDLGGHNFEPSIVSYTLEDLTETYMKKLYEVCESKCDNIMDSDFNNGFNLFNNYDLVMRQIESYIKFLSSIDRN